MRETRLLCAVTASLVGLILSLGQFTLAQDKKKDAEKKAPIAPAEKLAEGWDEIDERLIFLMVRLANTETSLEAVEKTIGVSSRKQSAKLGDAKRSVGENEKLDRKGGGPMKWSQFYGTTAEKFFYHPTDRNSFYHTQTVLSPQPPQNDNQTAPGIPSRQGLPVHQRPPQFDYIYKANQGAAAKAEAEAAAFKGKVEALAVRRRKLELEQVALWVEIAFRAAAHFELNKKPVFRFEPILAADDPDAKLHADIMKTAAAFMRVALSIVDEAPKDQDGTLVRIKPAISEAREKLDDAWLRLAVDTTDKKTVEGKFAALAKRLDDVSRNLTESYEISVDGDINADELRKDTFRGQLQGSLVSYAQIVLALDEMATQLKDQWKIKPDLDKPFGTVSLASITPHSQGTFSRREPQSSGAGKAFFNGKNLEGWSGFTKGFRAYDGELIAENLAPSQRGDILSDKEYDNFRLTFEFQLPPTANSGLTVRYRPNEPQNIKINIVGTKFMRVDRFGKPAPDDPQNSQVAVIIASGYSHPPTRPNPAPKVALPPQWNAIEVTANGDMLRIAVNGAEVIKSRFEDFATKDEDRDGWRKRRTGKIGFGNFTGTVRYRNIEMAPLKPQD